MLEKQRNKTEVNETQNLTDIDPIGEEIYIDQNTILQRLSPELLAQLQAQDSRVRYFPGIVPERDEQTEPEPFWESNRGTGHSYYSLVGNHVGAQIEKDFGGEEVLVRSTIATTIESFPWWQSDTPEGRDVRTVLDILASGSDTGKDETRVGHIIDGELNYQTLEWLDSRIGSLLLDSRLSAEHQDDARQTFPIIIVYQKSAFKNGEARHGWNDLQGPPEKRIAAIYITDKVNYTR